MSSLTVSRGWTQGEYLFPVHRIMELRKESRKEMRRCSLKIWREKNKRIKLKEFLFFPLKEDRQQPKMTSLSENNWGGGVLNRAALDGNTKEKKKEKFPLLIWGRGSNVVHRKDRK